MIFTFQFECRTLFDAVMASPAKYSVPARDAPAVKIVGGVVPAEYAAIQTSVILSGRFLRCITGSR